jgi:hypothetical protein
MQLSEIIGVYPFATLTKKKDALNVQEQFTHHLVSDKKIIYFTRENLNKKIAIYAFVNFNQDHFFPSVVMTCILIIPFEFSAFSDFLDIYIESI